LSFRPAQELLGLLGQFAGGGLSVAGGREAEAAQRTRVVATELKLNLQVTRRRERFRELEDRDMPLTKTLEDAPAGLGIAVNRQRRRGPVAAEPNLRVGLRRARELHRLAVRFDAELAEEEIALGAFVVGHAGAVRGQAVVGQGFEPQRGGAGGDGAELHSVSVVLADVPAGVNGVVWLGGQQRQVGLRFVRAQRRPVRGAGALRGEPVGEASCEVFGAGECLRGLPPLPGPLPRWGRGRRGLGGCGSGGFARREFARQVGEELCGALEIFAMLLGERGVGQVEVRFVRVVEERHQRVKLRVRDGVELVRVALGAAGREAEPRRARGGDPVHHRVEAELQWVNAALFVEHRVAVEAGGDDGV